MCAYTVTIYSVRTNVKYLPSWTFLCQVLQKEKLLWIIK